MYTVQYYSAIKKNKPLPFVTTRMDLEPILISKVSETDKYCIISLIYGI